MLRFSRVAMPLHYHLASSAVTIAATDTDTSPDREITNTYDGTYRLLEEEIATSGAGTVTTEYAYDDGNNRTSKDVDSGAEAGTTAYVIGDGTNGAGANQIKQATLPDTTVVAYTYDLNGNRLTRDDGTQEDALSYDYEQRLVELVRTGGTGSGTYEYAYDARTRRVVRDESGASGVDTKVVFSGGTSVQEYDLTSTPALMVEYLRGHDWGGGVGGILYTIRGGVESYAHASARGDVVSRTDDTGDVTWEAQYEAFGRHPNQAGTNADRQRANSKDEDPTGLLNEGFRYRDLETGTFITRDPAGFVDGPNLYTYVRQNPWTSFDPKGLQEKKEKPKEQKEKKKTKNFSKTIIENVRKEFFDEKSLPVPGDGVDLNMHSQGVAANPESNPNNAKDADNVFTSMGHGIATYEDGTAMKEPYILDQRALKSGDLQDESVPKMNANEFAKLVRQQSSWEGSECVVLYFCQTGMNGKNSFAQKLANELKVPVFAPTGNLYYGSKPGKATNIGMDPDVQTGTYQVFAPKKKFSLFSLFGGKN